MKAASLGVSHPVVLGGRVRASGDAFGRYECWQCGRTGRITEPTSVIVLAHRAFQVVKLAHAGCADSQIIGGRRRRDEGGAGELTLAFTRELPTQSHLPEAPS